MAPYTADDQNAYQLGPEDIWVPLGAVVQQKLGDVIYRYSSDLGQQRFAAYPNVNPRTSAQMNWRSVFANGYAAWNALPEPDKDTWRRAARRTYLNGHLLFMQDYLLTHTPATDPWVIGTSAIGHCIIS